MAATRPDIDVSRVAALARLELTPEETALFTRQLSEILAYAEAVQQIDTTGVPPTAHAVAGEPIWRDDVVVPSLDDLKVPTLTPARKITEKPYAGRRVAVIRGAAGELIELVEE